VCVRGDGTVTRVSYADMLGRALRLADGLEATGVGRGTPVALWMTNTVEHLEVYFAVACLGGVLVPVSTFINDHEVAHILRSSRASHLVMMDQFRRIEFIDRLSKIAPGLTSSLPGELHSTPVPDLRTVVVSGPTAPLLTFAHPYAQLSRGSFSLGSAVRGKRAKELWPPEGLASIMYTSGSTGPAKGVCLEAWGGVTNALLHGRRQRITSRDRFFSQMPLCHVGGSIRGLMTMLTAGGTLVMGETNDPDLATRSIEHERCTVYNGVPAMQYDILSSLSETPRDLSSLRVVSHLVDDVLQNELWSRFGVKQFYSAYGLTETYSVATVVDADDPEERRGTLGRPLDGVNVQVHHPGSGAELNAGEIGEIVVRGMITPGYFGLPEETGRAIDAEGWFHSQDLGYIDDGGYLVLVGRLKTMIKVGGENVAVEEVEAVVRSHPEVMEACVVGSPDRRLGEVPFVYYSVRPGGHVDIAQLTDFVARHLSKFKVPRGYAALDAMPMTPSGKVDRNAIAKAHGSSANNAGTHVHMA
jgi:fatty-acyl-CoA synthase